MAGGPENQKYQPGNQLGPAESTTNTTSAAGSLLNSAASGSQSTIIDALRLAKQWDIDSSSGETLTYFFLIHQLWATTLTTMVPTQHQVLLPSTPIIQQVPA